MQNNNQYLKNRAIWGGLLLLIMLLSLCGCSPSAKSEKEIVADFQETSFFLDENDEKVTDYEIIKRQTNTKNRTDMVYINVTVENDFVLWNRSYVMAYGLYNEGWILDEVIGYDESNWIFQPLKGVSEDVIQGYIDMYRDENMFDSVEVIDRVTTLNENWGDDFIVFQAVKEHLYATEILEFTQTWYFDECAYGYNIIGEPIQIDRTILPKETIIGAEWNNLARYYGTQDLFADQFDVKAESLSEDFGLKFSITKKDIWTAFWDRLDSPPEVSATIGGQYFTYFSYEGTEVVGIPLWRLKGELYNPWDYDEDDFDTDDFFIFDLDIPGKAKIQSIPASKRQNSVLKTAVTGRTIQESTMEYVISRMKSDGTVANDPDNPICGAWKSHRPYDDYEEWIIYICQDGTFFCYPILFYPTSYTPEVEHNLVQANMGFEGQWVYEDDCLYLHYQLNNDLLYQDEQMGRRDIAWKIAWEEDNNMFSSEAVSSVAGISTQDLHYNLYRVLF